MTASRNEPSSYFAQHDAESLGSLLGQKNPSPSACSLAVKKLFQTVYRRGFSSPLRWEKDTFRELGIGAWAYESLLELSPLPSLTMSERVPSEDGTIRFLFRTPDDGLIESVLIPTEGRTTLCVSSQVGCARACTFCETGRLGLSRQLSAAEIVDQVRLSLVDFPKSMTPLNNLVFMGMGEPFDNLKEVTRAIRLLTDSRAFAFAPSRITVSTVGVADKLRWFFENVPALLAISLNAPDDARRSEIMPVNDRFPLAKLREELLVSMPKGRRVLFEYVLFDKFNDSEADAVLLANYVRGIRCRVNVIPCNPGSDERYRPPTPERMDTFINRLAAEGVTVLVRRPRGRDVGGACGQLAGARRLGLISQSPRKRNAGGS